MRIGRSRPAFSIIEIILVLAVLTLLAGFMIPMYRMYQANSDLQTSGYELLQTLREAKTFARTGSNSSPWGVHVSSADGIVLFKGSTYASRDPGSDLQYGLPSTLTVSSYYLPVAGDVVFSVVQGLPNSTGSITLTQSITSRSITVTIGRWDMTLTSN